LLHIGNKTVVCTYLIKRMLLIFVGQWGEKWQAVVENIMKLWVPENSEYFF